MRRPFFVIGMIGAIAGVSASAAQITSYIDQRGRRVYINAEQPPEPPKKVTPKTRRSSRHSVLVRRDRITKQLVTVPPRPDPAEATPPADAAPAPATQRAAEQPATKLDEPVVAKKPAEPESGVSKDMDGMIADMAERHAVDPDLVRAIIKVESNFNPYAISHKGAMGLMQLIPGTAQRFGVSNVFDPEANLDGGVRYLKYLLGLYGGNLHLSLAAYNAGEKAVERHNGIPPYRETQQYVRRIAWLYRNGYISNPFTLSARGTRGQPDRWGIMKRIDEKGTVHFSNTEGW